MELYSLVMQAKLKDVEKIHLMVVDYKQPSKIKKEGLATLIAEWG